MASKHDAQTVHLYIPRKHWDAMEDEIHDLIMAAGGMSVFNDVTGAWVDAGNPEMEPVRILQVISTEQNWQPVADAVRAIIAELLRRREKEVLSLVQAGGELFKVVNTQEDLARLVQNA